MKHALNPTNAESDRPKGDTQTREYFIGTDTDDCAFDSMEIEQKECFYPQFINHFGLQRISKNAREGSMGRLSPGCFH